MLRVVSACVVLVFCIVSAASAQIIYEPVQYQYNSGGRSYFYGGADPLIHRNARAQSTYAGWGRTNGWAFHSGNVQTHREVAQEPARVYSDQSPTLNGRFHGLTADDARNQAYANTPRYFRKADVMKTAVRQEDGSFTVPAQIAPRNHIVIKPYAAPAKLPAAMPAREPRPILIIPKDMLDQPLWPSDDLVIQAR